MHDEPWMDFKEFRAKDGQVMGVFRTHDRRPGKLPAHTVAMPIETASRFAKKVARDKGIKCIKPWA